MSFLTNIYLQNRKYRTVHLEFSIVPWMTRWSNNQLYKFNLKKTGLHLADCYTVRTFCVFDGGD